jgi:hypothetical protein
MNKNQQWKDKVQEMFQVCQEEIKRTTKIGKKMLTASKTNTCRHEAYEELGQLAAKEIEAQNLSWEHPRVVELLEMIKNCETDLDEIEEEMNKIKFSASPQDVSDKPTDSVKPKETPKDN